MYHSITLDFEQYLAQVTKIVSLFRGYSSLDRSGGRVGLSWLALNMGNKVLVMVSWPVIHIDSSVGPNGTAVHSVYCLLPPNKTMVEVSSSLAPFPLCL